MGWQGFCQLKLHCHIQSRQYAGDNMEEINRRLIELKDALTKFETQVNSAINFESIEAGHIKHMLLLYIKNVKKHIESIENLIDTNRRG